MDAPHLIQRHLEPLHPRVLDVVAQVLFEEQLVEPVLLREAGRADLFDAGQDLLRLRVLALDFRRGHVRDLIVVALVAKEGGEFGAVLQAPFPSFVDEVTERLAAFVEIGGRQLGCIHGGGEKQEGGGGEEEASHQHSVSVRETRSQVAGQSPHPTGNRDRYIEALPFSSSRMMIVRRQSWSACWICGVRSCSSGARDWNLLLRLRQTVRMRRAGFCNRNGSTAAIACGTVEEAVTSTTAAAAAGGDIASRATRRSRGRGEGPAGAPLCNSNIERETAGARGFAAAYRTALRSRQ